MQCSQSQPHIVTPHGRAAKLIPLHFFNIRDCQVCDVLLGANSPPSAPYKLCCIEIPTQQKAKSLWEKMGRGHTSPWKPGELLKPGAPRSTQPQALLHRLIASAAADAWAAQGCSCLQSPASSPSRIPNRPVRHCCKILKLTGSRRRGCAGTFQQVSAALDSPALTVEHHNGPLRRIAQVLKHAIKVQAHGLRIKVPAQQTGGKGFGQGSRSYA